MKILRTVEQCQRWRASLPPKKSVGFVPTMGALHAGHLSLVERAHRENDIVVASIFVNPTQFGPKEDFARYPRPFAKDLRLLAKCHTSIVFAPTPKSMYAPDYSTSVSVSKLTDTLCGDPRSRGPAHFVGVATVVAKLFNAVRPTRAYFGMKDYQQVRVIEQMNQDLNFGIKIVRCQTFREKDGLAMSSRNAYLSPHERAVAPALYAALQQGRKLLTSKPSMTASAARHQIERSLSNRPDFKIEYIELVNPVSLERMNRIKLPVLVAVAARLGKTRLIDNILVSK